MTVFWEGCQVPSWIIRCDKRTGPPPERCGDQVLHKPMWIEIPYSRVRSSLLIDGGTLMQVVSLELASCARVRLRSFWQHEKPRTAEQAGAL
jgi:hypothetical protein